MIFYDIDLFHCDISKFKGHISLRYFIIMGGYFIAIFYCDVS